MALLFFRRPGTPARRLGLFLLSMAVPCVVLVALGVRIIVQQFVAAIRSSSDRLRAVDLALGAEAGERLGDLERCSRDSIGEDWR